MAYETPGFVYSEWWDGVAATIPQFSAVVIGADTLGLPGAGDEIHGIVQMPCIQNRDEQVRVMKAGISFCLIGGGGATKGNNLTAAADGTLVEAAAGDAIVGICLQTAAAGEESCVLLGYLGEEV